MAMALTQDPSDPRIVYAGSESGLFRTNAEGTRWESAGFNKDTAAVAISPANTARRIVVDADGRVYRSDDAGATWK